jgi:LPXTG-motif cell wall-anchored protein
MKNVKFMKNVLKIVAISIMFVLALSTRSFADEPINFDNLNFDNIPEAGSSSSSSTSTSTSTTTSTATSTKTNTTSNTTNSTSKTTSASKEKMPATGSNTEIIFAVAAVVLISTGIVLFRRQNIKLK